MSTFDRSYRKLVTTPQLPMPDLWITRIPLWMAKCTSNQARQLSEPERDSLLVGYWNVLGPIFVSAACDRAQWDITSSNMARNVMIGLSRLSLVLPDFAKQQVSKVLDEFTNQNLTAHEPWVTDEILELVVQNLAIYGPFIKISSSVKLMEWICDRMNADNVTKPTFTVPLLQYLDYLVNSYNFYDNDDKRSDLEEEMLYKVCKLLRWVEHLLSVDNQTTKTKSLEVFVEDNNDLESKAEDPNRKEVEQSNKSEYAIADSDQSNEDGEEQGRQEFNTEIDFQAEQLDSFTPENKSLLEDEELKCFSNYLDETKLIEQLIELKLVKQLKVQRAMVRYWRRFCRAIKRDCEELLN